MARYTLQEHLAWVASTTFLGCLSYSSVTKECYQIGYLEGSMRNFFISYISLSLFFRTPIGLHFWHYYHNHTTKELSRGSCVGSKKTSPEVLIYRLSERRH